MTCKECKPHFSNERPEIVLAARIDYIELCPRCEAIHSLTDRLARELRLQSGHTETCLCRVCKLLAEYDSAKNQEKQS